MEKPAFEPTGLVPRSIIRTVDRFRQQLLPESEVLAVQEFRISRYQLLVSIKCLLTLVLVPLSVGLLVKICFLRPVTEYFWNTHQTEIFLNSYQQGRALQEMEDFSEKLFFESLLLKAKEGDFHPTKSDPPLREHPSSSLRQEKDNGSTLSFSLEYTLQQAIQQKTLQLSLFYNDESVVAITNLCSDFITLGTLALLFFFMRPQIIILKSFLTESIYSLSDTTKSFLLILLTDLLVGFHSPRGWEISIELLLKHFGWPENQDFIFLFVATFPVFLDTVFKYWIFRYLNKISPSTVATYHNMIE
jgi:hypothetical protein